MRAVDLLLAIAVAVAGAHVLVSMQLPVAALVFGVLALLAPLPAWLGWRRPLAPTPGLAFIVFVSGGLLGYMGLADWVPVDSWAGDFAVFGGLCLAGLALLLWLLATRPAVPAGRAGDPAGDTLASSALVLALLIPRRVPAEGLVLVLPWIGALAGVLAPMVSRLGGRALLRAAWLLPVLALLPLAQPALRVAQQPLLGALFRAMPTPRGDTGFSPLARLRPDGLLRPARRPVLRLWVTGGTPPPYLVGNRLSTLDAGYEWKAAAAVGGDLEAINTDSGHRYRLDSGRETWSIAVHSLRRDDLVFVPPGTQHIDLPDAALGYDAAGVLQGQFAARTARRWQASGGPLLLSDPEPAAASDALVLPAFWDGELHAAAARLAGADAAQTAARVGAELRSRRYSLHYALDRQSPLKDFFLNRQPAHCFWYATAAVLALRANGVPARLVTGYRVGEQLDSALWLVRERDAHAWAEWQDAAGRWQTLDATPPDYGEVMADYGSGALERAWQRVVARLDAWWQGVQMTDGQVQGVLLAGLAALAGLFVREYRRLRRVPAQAQHSRQWLRLWRRFLRASGLPERAQWTAGDYLAQLPANWPAARRAAAGRFLEIYMSGRFAPDSRVDVAGVALREFRRCRLSA